MSTSLSDQRNRRRSGMFAATCLIEAKDYYFLESIQSLNDLHVHADHGRFQLDSRCANQISILRQHVARASGGFSSHSAESTASCPALPPLLRGAIRLGPTKARYVDFLHTYVARAIGTVRPSSLDPFSTGHEVSKEPPNVVLRVLLLRLFNVSSPLDGLSNYYVHAWSQAVLFM